MPRIQLQDAYHALFWEETKDQIEAMEQEILKIESHGADDESLNSIFRMAHSIKGSAATLHLDDMLAVSHALESVLTALKNNELKPETHIMETILCALDVLRKIHTELIVSDAPMLDFMTSVKSLESLLTTPSTLSRDIDAFPLEKIYGLKIIFEEDTDLLGLKAYIVIQALQSFTDVRSVTPENYETCEDDEFHSQMEIWLETEDSYESILEALDCITDIKAIEALKYEGKQTLDAERLMLSIQEEDGIEEPLLVNAQSPKDLAFNVGSMALDKSTVRVSINKINQLINLVGELIVDKESLHDIAKSLKETYGKDPQVIRLLDVFNHLHYIGSELQEIALSTRMLPLETLFKKYPRMVRDVSLTCEKQVSFIMTGAEHGIDRGMIEALSDPLTHLIRNAIDHGFETPEERLIVGKTAEGTLKLSASQGDNHILIMIEDDGRGIDAKRIQKKVLEKGWVTLEEVPFIGTEEWLDYIFEPGFSTADDVSEVSGRGVGLDVVKSNISKLNGQIEVTTEKGMGTRFTIKLPLTLAIINAMMVYEEGCTFAIPITSIVEIFRLKNDEIKERIHRTEFSQVLQWRDFAVPIVHLRQYFELSSGQIMGDTLFVIVLGSGEKKTALIVNEILGEQEVVIKSLGDFIGKHKLFGELKGISGVSILGDGSLAHVLDVTAIIV